MAPRLPFAAMRHRLTIEAPVETPDLAGGVQRTFAPIATLWGAIEPLEDGPAIVGDAPSSLATHRVSLRWRTGILAGQRIDHRRRHFAIRAVTDPDERRLRLVLAVEEIDA